MWDGRIGVLAAVSVGWFLLLGVRLVVPALFPRIRAEFAFSNTIAGSMYTVLLFVAALLQFPGGVAADRIGGRWILLFGCGAGFAGTALLATAPAVWAFLLGIVLFGVGTGLYGTPRVTVLSSVYPDRDGTAIGICSGSGNVGTTVLPVVAGALTAAFGWRFGFGFALPPFALALALLWWYVPNDTGRIETTATVRAILRSMRERSVLLATAVMTVAFFAYQGLTAFLPTYLVTMKSLPETTAATLFGLFFAGGVVSQVGGGNLGDRFGRRRTMFVLLVWSVASTLVLPFVSGVGPLAVVVLSLSLQLGFWPVVFSYAVAALPDEVQAGGLGLLRTVYLLVGSFGSTAVGALADADAFDGAFYLLAALLLVAALFCPFMPRVDGE